MEVARPDYARSRYSAEPPPLRIVEEQTVAAIDAACHPDPPRSIDCQIADGVGRPDQRLIQGRIDSKEPSHLALPRNPVEPAIGADPDRTLRIRSERPDHVAGQRPWLAGCAPEAAECVGRTVPAIETTANGPDPDRAVARLRQRDHESGARAVVVAGSCSRWPKTGAPGWWR